MSDVLAVLLLRRELTERQMRTFAPLLRWLAGREAKRMAETGAAVDKRIDDLGER